MNVLSIDDFIAEKLNISPITKTHLDDMKTDSYKNKRDYDVVKYTVNNMDFEDVKKLPQKDNRFYFGAMNGDEGDDLIDLGFETVLVTVTNKNGKAVVSDNYEVYND